MAYDLVRPLGLECPSEGGTQLYPVPTEINPLADAIPTAGVALQDTTGTTVDQKVLVDRSINNLRLTDTTTSHILGELVSSTTGQVGSHDALRDLQHFIGDEGPGTGFASGAYLSRTWTGVLVTNETWWTSSAQTSKIISKTWTYSSGSPVPSSVSWTLYAASGSALRTLTDTYTYSGPVAISTSRTWS